MRLTRWTICACTSCGYPVVGAHDCDRQRQENDGELSALGRVVFLNARGELIARLSRQKQ